MQERAHLGLFWCEDGSLEIHGRLAPEDGALLLRALDAMRDKTWLGSAEPRPARQASNAEALVAVAEAALTNTDSSRTGGERYRVVVDADADVLADDEGDGGCALEDGSAIAPETARRLACDASLVRSGRESRTVPAAMRRALQARDRGCRFPGCENRRFLDAHHIHHWAKGGKTTPENLLLLCRRHHRRVHEGGYRLDPDGQFYDRWGELVTAAPHLPRGRPDELLDLNRHLGIDADTCDSGLGESGPRLRGRCIPLDRPRGGRAAGREGATLLGMTETIEAPAALRQINHWIGGRSVAGASGRSGPVYNPATGRQAGEVDFASVEEVDRAVQAAKAAFPAWRAVSLAKRAELFFRIRELVHDRREEVARILTQEHGKVLSDAIGEVTRGLEVIEFCCGLPSLLKSEYSEQVSTGIDVYSIRQPLGVVAGITPFNFPAMVPMWMWAPAIACGNTFVLKPSEKDPSASIWTAELLKEAGLPDGVFNVVHGDKVAVDAVLEHPDIAAVSFVGSTPIARYVYETATSRGKRCQALGGAKNHMIVLPDADIDMAADAAVSAAYGSAGERCMAISQVVAVGQAHAPLVEAIKARIPKVKVGDGLDPSSEMGPLITEAHRDKVASYVENAPAEGATVLVDGREGAPGEGFFLLPSLIDEVKPGMKAYDDEIFGPVLGVAHVDTYDEAVELVNKSPYGNGTAIFTRDGGVARQFQFDVQAGMVGVNVPIPVPVAYYSFGGWKGSLFGDRHIYGPEGIDFYTRGKVVTSRWPDPATSKVDLGFPQTR